MNNKNLKPFKKGDARINRKGQPKKIPELTEIMSEAMGMEKSNGITYMQAVINKLREKALKGDMRAAEILLERVYGKVKQELDHHIKSEQLIAKIEIIKIVHDDNQPGTTDTPGTEAISNDKGELEP